MKTESLAGKHGKRQSAFTITEVMVSGTLVMVILAGVLTSHLTGMRMFQITKAKLGANTEAREAISRMIDEIRTAKRVKIGEGNLSEFAETPPNTGQIGNAVQIYPSGNTNDFIRYFWDPSDKQLKRTTNGATSALVVANSITNQMIFSAEDHLGTVLNNHHNNRVIGLTLQFFQIQYPVILIGPGQYYDFYQLRTRITRRALE